jgi:hypothetical protein
MFRNSANALRNLYVIRHSSVRHKDKCRFNAHRRAPGSRTTESAATVCACQHHVWANRCSDSCVQLATSTGPASQGEAIIYAGRDRHSCRSLSAIVSNVRRLPESQIIEILRSCEAVVATHSLSLSCIPRVQIFSPPESNQSRVLGRSQSHRLSTNTKQHRHRRWLARDERTTGALDCDAQKTWPQHSKYDLIQHDQAALDSYPYRFRSM